MIRALSLAALVLAGCTPAIYEVGGVREAQASEVAGCSLLGTVTGQPGVFGPLSDIGLKDARRAALEKAREQGGNRVVFDPIPQDAPVTELPGRVYFCQEIQS